MNRSCFELRQVAGAAQRVGVDEERRLDLGVAVLARVQVEHEVDERARRAARRRRISTEKRAPDILRRALEVEDAERRAELPVRLRLEVERRAARRAGGPPWLSAALVPTGTLACGRFGIVISSALRCCST